MGYPVGDASPTQMSRLSNKLPLCSSLVSESGLAAPTGGVKFPNLKFLLKLYPFCRP